MKTNRKWIDIQSFTRTHNTIEKSNSKIEHEMSKREAHNKPLTTEKGQPFCLHTRELLLNLIWNATQQNNWNRWFSSFCLSRIPILFALLLASFVVTSSYSLSSPCLYPTSQHLDWYFHFLFEAQRYGFFFRWIFYVPFIGWWMLLCRSIFDFIMVEGLARRFCVCLLT